MASLPQLRLPTGRRSTYRQCKFWLAPVRLARSENVKPVVMRRIEAVVVEQETFFLEKWHEYFPH